MAQSDWRDYPATDDGAEHTVVGILKVLPELESPQLGNRREILAYLPPSYYEDEQRRYPVLYMHDGQNLFDAAASFSGEWRVDETMEVVSQEGREAIVIGIPNLGESRLDEYSPFVDEAHGGGRGDEYLDFVVQTLKPRVDADFRTLPDRDNTGIMGSSMGGLISTYAFFRHPEVFGFVGAMSPSFWFADRAIFRMAEAAPHVAGRVYLDVGTEEGKETLRDVREMRRVLHEKGYAADHALMYVEDQGATHSEAAWAWRLYSALDFLLPPPQLSGDGPDAGAARE